MPGMLGEEPPVVQHLVEELSRFDLRTVFRRNHAHGRLVDLAHPVGRHHFKILVLPPRGRAIRVKVVEQSPSLVLLHIEAGQTHELAGRIPGIDHARPHQHVGAVRGGLHLKLIHVEAELVELVDALLDLPHFVRIEGIDVGERAPQRMVAVHQPVADFDFVHIAREQLAGAQIHQLADDIRVRQVDIIFALTFGEVRMQIAGFGVHKERRVRVGITQEQHVGQRDIAPVEAGQMQPDHKHGEGVNQPFRGIGAQVPREQRAVRQRVFQMLGHQHGFERVAVLVVAPGDDGDRRDRGQIELAQPPEQLVLPFRHAARDFLHRVDIIADAHEADDVPGNASRQIHQQVIRPSGQRLVPRQSEHLRVRARRRDLQRLRLLRLGVFVLRLDRCRIHCARVKL